MPRKRKKKSKNLFNEEQVYALVEKWKESYDVKLFHEIVDKSLPLIKSLAVKAYRSMPNPIEDPEDLINDAVVKLPQILDDYEPGRGSRLFSYLTACVGNFLRSQIHKLSIRGMGSYSELEDSLEDCESELKMDQLDNNMDIKEVIRNATIPYFDRESQKILHFYLQAFKEGIFVRNRKRLAVTASYMFDRELVECSFLYHHLRVCLRIAFLEVFLNKNVDAISLWDSASRTHLPRIANLIGRENTNKLMAVFGGISVRFPSLKKIEKFQKKISIFEQMHDLMSPDEVEAIAKANKVSKRRAKKIYDQMLSLIGDKANHDKLSVSSVLGENYESSSLCSSLLDDDKDGEDTKDED